MKETLSTEELAYLAGYFDGEGSISIHIRANKGTSPSLSIAVSTGDKEVVELFARTFGGSVYPVKPGKRTRRQIFIWTQAGNKGQAVLRLLLPFLKAKLYPAEEALKLTFLPSGTGRGRHGISEEELILRQQVAERVSAFNNRITIN